MANKDEQAPPNPAAIGKKLGTLRKRLENILKEEGIAHWKGHLVVREPGEPGNLVIVGDNDDVNFMKGVLAVHQGKREAEGAVGGLVPGEPGRD